MGTRWPSVSSLPRRLRGQGGRVQGWPGAQAFKRKPVPRGQRMEVMIAQGTIAQGPRQGARGDTGSPRGRPRTRGQLGRAGSGLARPGRVEGAAGGGGWPGPAGEGPLCTWSSWCIEAPPAWGAVLTSLGLSLFFSGGRAPFGVGPCGPSRALLSDFRSWASFPDSPQTPVSAPKGSPRSSQAFAPPTPPTSSLGTCPLLQAALPDFPWAPWSKSLPKAPLPVISGYTGKGLRLPLCVSAHPGLPRVGSRLAVWVYWMGAWSQHELSEARLFLATLGGGSAEGPAQRHPPGLLHCPLGLKEELSSGVMGRWALCYRHSGFTESPEL